MKPSLTILARNTLLKKIHYVLNVLKALLIYCLVLQLTVEWFIFLMTLLLYGMDSVNIAMIGYL
jgi:hypothetical protein